ncbi:MAG: monothiol glutaredoxin [Bradymonadia bacterium]|jgi:monothiol glutaredoxin
MSKKIELPISNPNYGDPVPTQAASGPLNRAEGGDVMSEIAKETTENAVFLYMKGTPDFPQCGFSNRVASILSHLGATYASCNILADAEKREAIKVFSDWPTIPQLYVNGEFVGGSDIITEMFQAGELEEMIGTK